MQLPRFYPILDTATLERLGLDAVEAARALTAAGAGIVQFRHKGPFTRPVFELAKAIGRIVQRAGALYAVNDRADIALILGADGVHLGQDDLPPSSVRRLAGDRLFIGYSTHNEAQLRAGDREPADYLALGPIFGTASKKDPDPAVGPAELARLRPLTSKPLVAIGGITLLNAPLVLEAGAASAAVISGWLTDDWRASIAEWVSI
jgi:thiamine-phosphate pyrophosphorylase